MDCFHLTFHIYCCLTRRARRMWGWYRQVFLTHRVPQNKAKCSARHRFTIHSIEAITDRFSSVLATRESRRHTRASPRTCPLPGDRSFVGRASCGEGETPYALTFGMETREDTVQFRRRKLAALRSIVHLFGKRSWSLLEAIDESPTGSLREVIRPGQGLPLGTPGHCPRPPRGRGRSAAGRAGWRVRGIAACGEGASPICANFSYEDPSG